MPASILARPAADEHIPYFGRYTALVPPGDLIAHAEAQVLELRALLSPLSAEQSRHRYAEEKWSIREVVGHLTDVERVFAYRATAFSRRDPAPLPGYDQAAWLPMGEYDDRALPDLLDEWECARRAMSALMRGMPASALGARGIASDAEISVLALLTIPVGHVAYHVQLLARDYGVGADR
ncbi:MAG TPA: DinB family protein [Gemmatimonadaceae bacterium]|nr:DinB family protein [Gemmatimonadaceae bacterium]